MLRANRTYGHSRKNLNWPLKAASSTGKHSFSGVKLCRNIQGQVAPLSPLDSIPPRCFFYGVFGTSIAVNIFCDDRKYLGAEAHPFSLALISDRRGRVPAFYFTFPFIVLITLPPPSLRCQRLYCHCRSRGR